MNEYAKCPYCGKTNECKDGKYFWCSCRDVGERGVFYLPLEIVEERKKKKLRQNQLFLDDEERNSPLNNETKTI